MLHVTRLLMPYEQDLNKSEYCTKVSGHCFSRISTLASSMETKPQRFWTFFDDSGHSSGELEVHTHTATMHPGKTTCIRLLRRRRGPNGLYAFILLRGEENLPSTTGRLRCHDHDTTGALRPRPASSTTCSISGLHTNMFPATYRVSHSIKEKSSKKPLSKLKPHPHWTFILN